MDGLPRLTRLDDSHISLHATGISCQGKGLLLCGASGAGKSGTAAQLIAFGAVLVCDDLCVLAKNGDRVDLRRPPGAPAAMELRGLGIVHPPSIDMAPLTAMVILGPSRARLPGMETIDLFGHGIPVLRHPARHDTAAKLWLWCT